MSLIELLIKIKNIEKPKDLLNIQEILIDRIVFYEKMIRKRRYLITLIKKAKFDYTRSSDKVIERIKKYDQIIERVKDSENYFNTKRNRMLYLGDTLAFSFYPKYIIKGLSKNEPPGFIEEKVGNELEYEVAKSATEQECYSLMHDLTHCLRIGDVSVMKPDGDYEIIECKAISSEFHYISDRIKRQSERLRYTKNALNTDGLLTDKEERLKHYEYSIPAGYLEIDTNENYLVNEFIGVCDLAEDETYRLIRPENGLIYGVCSIDGVDEYLDFLEENIVKDFILISDIYRRVEGDFPYVPPITGLDIPDELIEEILTCRKLFNVFIDLNFILDELNKKEIHCDKVIIDQNDLYGFRLDMGILGGRWIHEVQYGLLSLSNGIDNLEKIVISVKKNFKDLERNGKKS